VGSPGGARQTKSTGDQTESCIFTSRRCHSTAAFTVCSVSYDKDKTSNQSLSPSLENSRQTSGDKSLIDLSSGSSSAKVSASSVPLSQYNELLETLNASKRQVEKLNKAVEDLKREQIETKNEVSHIPYGIVLPLSITCLF